MGYKTSRDELCKLLCNGLSEMNLFLAKEQENKLIQFVLLMHAYNHACLLTSIRDTDKMISRHILDSLSIFQHIKKNSMIDLGSGAGLPGIPLSILMPDRNFILLDSNIKKINFLEKAKQELQLNNVHITHHLVEEYKPEKPIEGVISRSFGVFPDFLTLIHPFLKPNAQILSMTGVYPTLELAYINKPFKLVKVHPLKIPYIDAQRHVIEVKLDSVGE
jgi:16S rRNA (guanine527-N7)-methyltransferase